MTLFTPCYSLLSHKFRDAVSLLSITSENIVSPTDKVAPFLHIHNHLGQLSTTILSPVLLLSLINLDPPISTKTQYNLTAMPGLHGSCCPCGFRYVPDSSGYTCEGGHHRLNRTGEDIEEQNKRDRERRRNIMVSQDKQRTADIERQKEKKRERERERKKKKSGRDRKTRRLDGRERNRSRRLISRIKDVKLWLE